MKTILSTISVVTAIAFVLLMLAAMIMYPMHLGEPSWYHVARVDCLMASTICGFVSFVSAVSAMVSVHF